MTALTLRSNRSAAIRRWPQRPRRLKKVAVSAKPAGTPSRAVPASIGDLQGMATWFSGYIAALERLLVWRGKESNRIRNLCGDPDTALYELASDFRMLKALWPCRAVMEDEVIGEDSIEPARSPVVPATSVPMTFIRIGRQPPRLADVIEVDSLEDEAVAPMPPPPSKRVTLRFQWVGRPTPTKE